jgi:hypothetical protein
LRINFIYFESNILDFNLDSASILFCNNVFVQSHTSLFHLTIIAISVISSHLSNNSLIDSIIYSFSTRFDFALSSVVILLLSFSHPDETSDLFRPGILLINLSLLLEIK